MNRNALLLAGLTSAGMTIGGVMDKVNGPESRCVTFPVPVVDSITVCTHDETEGVALGGLGGAGIASIVVAVRRLPEQY